MTTPSPTVIEEARKMAAWAMDRLPYERPMSFDRLDRVLNEAFIAAIELGERRADAAVVGWLRTVLPMPVQHTYDHLADAIERGDHRSKP